MFSAFDENEDKYLSWKEWEKFVNAHGGHTKETTERMNFNFIDFNRDDKISKDEYLYYLDNFTGNQSLMIIPEFKTPEAMKFDPVIMLLVVINIVVIFATVRHVFSNKKRDDSFKKKISILV